MIEVGQKVRFDPFKESSGFYTKTNRKGAQLGTVCYVNRRHKWFSVEYNIPKLRTSFKFSQIGMDVQLSK